VISALICYVKADHQIGVQKMFKKLVRITQAKCGPWKKSKGWECKKAAMYGIVAVDGGANQSIADTNGGKF